MLELSLTTPELEWHSGGDQTQFLNPGSLDLMFSYSELVGLGQHSNYSSKDSDTPIY